MIVGAKASPVSGFLNINKDPGMTSMDVLRRIKRLTGQKKVGHGGTLDPDATGVLPVCIGRATRFISFVVEGRKVYRMTCRLGVATDTYDAAGRVTLERDPSGIARADVLAALERFRGEFDQVPPMYSAIKRGGQPLYKMARAGVEVEREPRRVRVHALRLAEWAPPDFVLEVESGRGFYARSLAHDIGRALGNAAHLAALVRRKAGPFHIRDSTTLAELEADVERGTWENALYPIDTVLSRLPALVVDPLKQELLTHGQPVRVRLRECDEETIAEGQRVRVYAREGALVAVARYRSLGSRWQPERVVAAT